MVDATGAEGTTTTETAAAAVTTETTLPPNAVTPADAARIRMEAYMEGKPSPIFTKEPLKPVEQKPTENTPAATEAVPVKAEEVVAVTKAEATPTAVPDARAAAFAALRGEAPAAPAEIPAPVLDWAKSQGYTPEEVGSLHTMREAASKLPQVEAEYAKVREFFAGLPGPLQKAIDQYSNGNNAWRDELAATPEVDWSKPFDKQDPNEMLRQFVPGQVSEDVLEKAKDGDEAAQREVKLALEIAKRDFTAKKSDLDGYFTSQRAEQEKFQQELSASVDQDINNLLRSKPEVAPLISEIRQHLTHDGISKLFFNNARTLKPGASYAVALALYQNELFESKVAGETKKAKDTAELEMLRRTPEKVTEAAKGQQQPQKTPEQLLRERVRAWETGQDLLGPSR